MRILIISAKSGISIGMNHVGSNFKNMEKEAKLVFTQHGEASSVFCGSLNRDSSHAVTGGEDNIAYVWDAKTGNVVFQTTNNEDSIIFAGFNHDDSCLATCDMSGLIQVWKTTDQTLLWNFNMGDATWMKWHPKANVIIAGAEEGETYMWKIPSGECKVMQGNGSRAEIGSLFPDGKRLAVGYSNGDIHVIDLSTAETKHVISSHESHKGTVTSIDCHLNDKVIISAGRDGKTIVNPIGEKTTTIILQIINNETACSSTNNIEESDVIDETEEMETNTDNWVEAVAFQKDVNSQIAATGTINGDIFIWNFVNKVQRTKIQQEGGVTLLTWKGSSWNLFVGSTNGDVRCYDGRIGVCIQKYVGHIDTILDLHISIDEKTLLTTSDDCTARIYEIDPS